MKRAVKKKKQRILNKLFAGGAIFAALQVLMPTKPVSALPVLSDDARTNIEHVTNGTNMTVSLKDSVTNGNGFAAWRDFSIALGEKVTFSGMTNMLNYVVAVNPSLIYGTIDAATVDKFYIINPNGIYFGPNSMVTTNNFIVSTRELTDDIINNYISGNGTLNLDNNPTINGEGWLKSSDITGTYDVADGDVMFLGKVQANKVTVEGNHIQIRNTKHFQKLTENGQPVSDTNPKLTPDWTTINTNTLSGSDMAFYSGNPIEVGYEVDTSGIDLSSWGLVEPFDTLNETTTRTRDEAINTLAQQYDIFIGGTDETLNTANKTVIDTNRQILGKLYDFFVEKAPTDRNDPKNKLLAIAMDQYIKELITKGYVAKKIDYTKDVATQAGRFIYNQDIYDYEYIDTADVTITYTEGDYEQVNVLSSIPDYFGMRVMAKFEELKSAYDNRANYANPYYIADKIGDANMAGSGSKLGYTAQNLARTGNTDIRNYRLVQTAEELEMINKSVYDSVNQLIPQEGVVSGNYMLGADIDLTGVNFKPLGYAMTNDNFVTASDQINFNGLNFTVKGLKTDTTTGKYQGLFSVFSGTVKNLRLKDVTIEAGQKDSADEVGASGGLIGAIVGKTGTNLETTIKNVSVTGTVEGDNAGGLVGITGAGDGEVTSFHNKTQTLTTENQYFQEYLEHYNDLEYAETHRDNPFFYESTLGVYIYDIGTGTVLYRDPKDINTFLGNSNDTSKPSVVWQGAATVTFENVDSFMPPTPSTDADTTQGITGGTTAGGILGYGQKGTLTFKNVINGGTITSGDSSSSAGGIIGKAFAGSNGDFKLPYNPAYGSLRVDGRVSGVDSVILKNAANIGTITAPTGYGGGSAGGLAGSLTYVGQIKSNGEVIAPAVYLGNITDSYNRGTVTGSSAAGLAGGYVNFVSKSFNTGIIGNTDTTNAGGLVSSVFGNITNSYNAGAITASGSGKVGGLVSETINGNIEYAYNSGDITGSATYMGGLVGYSSYGKIKDSYNLGNLENTGSSARTAGIVGYQMSGATGTVLENVYNFGNISGTGSYKTNVSGIATKFATSGIKLNNVCNFGDVTSGASNGFAAGISSADGSGSYSFDSSTTLTNVYNFGTIHATGTSGENYASGIATRFKSSPTLTGVYNFGDVIADGSTGSAAGIAAYSQAFYGKATLKNVYNFGDISATGMYKTYASGIASGFYNSGDLKVTLENVYNIGKVTSAGATGRAAGIAAYDESFYGKNIYLKNVYNFGDIFATGTTNTNYASGIATQFGNDKNAKATLTNVYNVGKVTAAGVGGQAAGIAAYYYKDSWSTKSSIWGNAVLEGVYNFGEIKATGSGTSYASGIATRFQYFPKLTDVYNFGNVETTSADGYTSGIAYEFAYNPTKTNVYNTGILTKAGVVTEGSTSENATLTTGWNTTTDALTAAGIILKEKPSEPTRESVVTGAGEENYTTLKNNLMDTMWTAFDADKNGEATTIKTWRVYANPENLLDKTRQPLLTQFMRNATVKRYSQLNADGSITPYYLVSAADGYINNIHNSKGGTTYVRYTNTGLNAMTSDGQSYYILNPADVKNHVIQTADDGDFAVKSGGTEMAKNLMYSGQFGYNFSFDDNKSDWDSTTANKRNITEDPINNPADNAIYLKLGNSAAPNTPGTTEPIDPTPPETDIETIRYTITVDSGTIYNNSGEVTWNTTGDSTTHYTSTIPATETDFTITQTNTNSAGQTTVKVNYKGQEYTAVNNVVTINTDGKVYIIRIVPGNIGTQNTGTTPGATTVIPVTITVDPGKTLTKADGTTTFTTTGTNSGGYGVTSTDDAINTLLGNGVLKVIPLDGKTTVTFGDGNLTYTPDGTGTYTDGNGTTYTFTRNNDGTFTYVNGDKIYRITIKTGNLDTETDKNVVINVNPGVIDTSGHFTVNLTNGLGYTVDDSTIGGLISGIPVIPVTYADGTKHSTMTLPTGFDLMTGTENVYKYTRTTTLTTGGTAVMVYMVTLNPGGVEILQDTGGGYTPNPTPSTPDPELETPAPTPTPPRVTPVTPAVEPTPEPTPVIPTPAPVVPVTPVVPAVEPTPEPAPVTPVIAVPEEVTTPENLDPHLDNSDMQTFNFENGDYIDLDLQDHFLVDSFNADEKVNTLGDNPGEFATAMDRNQVDNHIDLTSITETSGTGDVGEIGGGNGGGLIGFQNLSGDNGGQSSDGGQTGGLSGAVGGNNGGDSSGEGEGGNQPSMGKDESQGVDQSGVNGKAADGNKTSDSGKTSGSDKKSGTDKKSDSNDKGDSENSDSDDEDKDKDNGEGEGEEQK